MPTTKFTAEMFPSEASSTTNIMSRAREIMFADERWRSFYEFIAFCIGKHSTLTIFAHYHKLNFVQDMIFYLLVGIPVCYVQLILGQYTNVGIFLIRRMLPLAEGISYTYFLTIFALTIIIVIEVETNLTYLILAFSPATEFVWNVCPPNFKDVCWDFAQNCTVEKPCMDANTLLPTYIFWNETYMERALPIHKAGFGMPDYRKTIVTFVAWLFIYFLTIVNFRSTKTSVQILVAISVVLKIMFSFQYGASLGYISLVWEVMKINSDTWLDGEAWKSSLSRVISSMMLGDFTYIMFGVYATFNAKTGSLSFTGAICGYCILFLEVILIKGAVLTLTKYSKINPDQTQIFFAYNAPLSLIIPPAALGLLKRPHIWVVLYFFMNIITNLIWCVINIAFMQQSLYQRFTGMKSYYKYICPAFCIVGFTFGVFVQTRELYEIRSDLTKVIDSFCQHLNLILLTGMIVFIYGFKRLGDDIQFMTGKQPADFWKITWVVSPIIMTITIPTEYWYYDHPFFTYRILTVLIVFSPVIIFGVVFTMKKLYNRDVLGLLKSSSLWGPKDKQMRIQRNGFHPRKQSKYKRYHTKCPHQCLLHNQVYAEVVRGENYYDQFVIDVIPRA